MKIVSDTAGMTADSKSAITERANGEYRSVWEWLSIAVWEVTRIDTADDGFGIPVPVEKRKYREA